MFIIIFGSLVVQIPSHFFFRFFVFLALNENMLMCVGKVVTILTSLIKTIGDLYINHIKLIHLSGTINIFILLYLTIHEYSSSKFF